MDFASSIHYLLLGFEELLCEATELQYFAFDKWVVTDDCNRVCTHSAKAKPEGSDEVRNCRCRSREHDAETSHA